jgi:signal transduction histidine kinase/DNA-binding response OmpR family regulator
MPEIPVSRSHPSSFDPLAGGGEMGALMRSIDWSKTSIGSVSTWPQSLRTALSILLENHFPMYIAWGPHYTQFYNDGYRPILGSTKHPQAMGLSASETFAESWHIIGPMFDGVMQGNAVGSDNWMLPLDRYGFLEECYFNFSYSPIRDESGQVGGVLVTVSETTARVLGERRLLVLQALASRTQEVTSLEAACAVIMQILSESPAEVPFAQLYVLSDNGRSAHLAGVAGISPDEAPGPIEVDLTQPDATWSLDAVAATGAARLVDISGMTPTLETEGAIAAVRRAFVLPITHSGEARPAGLLVVGTSPRLQFDDKYRGFLELVASQIATTLASVRALEEARSRAEALAEIDRAKTAFFSNVSHEFRTPLTLLLGPAEDALATASRDGGLDLERWQVVHRNALRLLKLVNTLLDFSRIEAGRLQASYQPTELSGFTSELASVFRSAIERAGLTLDLDLPALDEPVFIDHDMWEKVIFNLLSNALKFTFHGSIGLSLRRDGDFAELAVRDTGVGIPATELPRLFDRFHRVPGAKARTQEGTGIGLALVRELVKLHGGSVEATSVADEGTEFTVRLPLGSAHLPPEQLSAPRGDLQSSLAASAFLGEAERWLPAAGPEANEGPEDDTAPGRRSRVVLVDDNADMRDYVARLLRERWRVESVADGATALRTIRNQPPDLVLTDVMMPGLNGFELLHELRTDPATRAIPVIFLSARAGEEARVEGLHAGADDYLAKPFSARELMARVETHLELSRLRVAAERERARVLAQFMQAPVAVSVVTGPDFVFELANPRYEEMVGRRNLHGKRFRDAFPELTDDAPVLTMLRDVYEKGEPFAADEFPVQLDLSGSGVPLTTYFKFTSQPLFDRNGLTDSIMTVAVNVTDEVTARQLLESQAAELDRLNRAKDEFLATLSHELRTPLTSILGWAKLLKIQTADPAMLHTGLDSIDKSAHIQATLIDDVLDLSRIRTGKVRIDSEAIDLAAVASAALDGVQLAAQAKNIRLEQHLGEQGRTMVLGDGNRLQQVVWNLLTNAIKFTPSGGRVTVVIENRNGAATLRVSDTGIGIPPNFLRDVFESFRQVDSSSTRIYGGLGLGLSIVRHLVELHGGHVTAASEGEGHGATFVVELPLLQPNEGAAAKQTARAIQESADPPSGNPVLDDISILVIDDQEAVCVFLAAALRRCGARVRLALSVRAGIQAVEQELPDIALCDIAMPREDGFVFIEWMKSRNATRSVPVLAVTAFGRPEDEQRTLSAGFSGYVRKPVDPFDLASQVAAVMRGRS